MNRIIRNKDNGYSVINNHCLRNKNISEKAKGVFAIIMSLPDNWDFSINGLISICHGGETAIRSAIKELIEHGYCERRVVKDSDTKRILGWEYTFSEKPLCDSPQVEEPKLDIQDLGNQVQLSKEELIPKKEKKEVDYDALLLFWNTLFDGTKIKQISVITEKRKKAILAVLNVYNKNQVKLALEKVKNSNFAQGDNDRAWTVSFDWFFIVGNFTKVLEGNYDNKNTINSKAIY
jgi:hypothetical protein